MELTKGTRNVNRAYVLGLWEDRSSYEAFMSGHHDEILERMRQDKTYTNCKAQTFDTVFEMSGSSDDFVGALKAASVLRVARCMVRAERERHFSTIQRAHWVPGMRNAGMLGGLFSRRNGEQPEYLVTTAWRDQQSHSRYIKDYFPSLRAAAGIDDDVASLDGLLLVLEKRWWIDIA